MSEQAASLADQVARAADEFAAVISGATDEQLGRLCPGDGWPVWMTAFHVATAYRVQASWLRRMAKGEAISATRDQIDAGNATMAQDPTPHPRGEIQQQLQDHSMRLVEAIRNLSDEQLVAPAMFGPADRTLTPKQVIRHTVLTHIAEHIADVHAALA